MDVLPSYLLDPTKAQFGPANLLQMQAAMLPPDQSQVQTAQLAPQEQKINPPKADPHEALQALRSRLPASAPPPNSDLLAYQDAANKATNDQKASLSGLNDYINQMSAKPVGLNLSPLAAYIDSYTGSKLAPVAEKMAPMSQEEKDKAIAGLKQQLAQGQAKVSVEALQALKEQQAISQNQRHQTELERHDQAMEMNNQGKSGAQMGRVETMKDTQTAQAVDKVTNDAQLKSYVPRIQGADRILGQLAEVRSGHIVDTRQFLNDLNTEYVNLLTGASNSALGKQERTEYTSYAADLSALKQKIEANPESINSPAILDQLEKSVKSLQKTYRSNYDQRADQLPRSYRYNPDATEQQAGQVQKQKAQYGMAAMNAEAPSKIRVSNGKETLMIDASDLQHAVNDGYKQVK